MPATKKTTPAARRTRIATRAALPGKADVWANIPLSRPLETAPIEDEAETYTEDHREARIALNGIRVVEVARMMGQPGGLTVPMTGFEGKFIRELPKVIPDDSATRGAVARSVDVLLGRCY